MDGHDCIRGLLDELYRLFYINPDLRYYGEHPDCQIYEDRLISAFREMRGEEVEACLRDMNIRRLDSMHFVLEEILDCHPFVRTYLDKTGW